jgi:hypothetical protein
VKTYNLWMLYLVFGNEVRLTYLKVLFSNKLFTNFYETIAFILMKFTFLWCQLKLHGFALW